MKILGCRRAVSEGISWFFTQEEEGIILEDDCIPNASFFQYCDELLEYYRDSEEIGVITGNCFVEKQLRKIKTSYVTTAFNHCWGWATWRRAWEKYDTNMESFEPLQCSEMLRKMGFTKPMRAYWLARFSEVSEYKVNTWDYVFTYSLWKEGLLTCMPVKNLVRNIGFDEEGTHTTGGTNDANSSSELEFPLKHLPCINHDTKMDMQIMRSSFWLRAESSCEKTY